MTPEIESAAKGMRRLSAIILMIALYYPTKATAFFYRLFRERDR